MRFRVQHDGSLLAPARGVPPPAPSGFMQDPGNEYHYIPELEPCEHRVKKTKTSSCCGEQTLSYCKRKQKYTIYNMCMACDVPKKSPAMADCELYQALYDDKALHYGSAKHNRCPGVRYLPQYLKHLVSPVMDLGCGTGDTVTAMHEAGFVAQGMDWIDRGLNHIVCDITKEQDLSLYKSAICIDVFEHVTDDCLHGLIANLQQVIHQVVTVYCGSSKERGYTQELHTNIKTPSEWTRYLEQYFDIIETIRLATNRYLYLMKRKHIEAS